ncbi:MAG: hypothetical protein R3A44_12205 [Caldilineaceae bacterium]
MRLTNCQKLLVMGISGAGKTHFSRQLAALTRLPLYHMDSIIWGAHWAEIDETIVQQKLDALAQTNGWIIEGWIDWYSRAIIASADAVIYLDFPGWLAVWGGLQRWFRHRKSGRPELPPGCHETWDWGYLRVMYNRAERSHIEAMLAESMPKQLIRVTSRRAANALLKESMGRG